jgi:integrase
MKKNRIKPRDSRNLFFHDGVWLLDIQINGRRYREVAGPTEAKARLYRDKLRAWKRDVTLGLPAIKPEGEPMKFEAFAEDYLTLYAKRKKSYSRDAISIAHLKAFFSGWRLQDINAESVARYRASREGLSPATINRELACLRTALRKAVEWGKLNTYPLPKEKLLDREPEFKPRILEPEEARRIVQVADPHWLRPAVIVWLNTGLRKMELLRLRREDVDLKGRRLTVISANAKNGKERTIPINRVVTETLEAMPGETYFFENPRTKTHVRDLLESFRAALTKAKIKGRVRIHDLRDTFATLALRGGVDIRTVAELIGDSPEVALKRYCHSDEKTKREAVERISDIIIESRPKVHEGTIEELQPVSESVS